MCPRRHLLHLLAILTILPKLTYAVEKPWREIRSPHFRVITNGSEGAARRVANAFEQMRSVIASEFPGYRIAPPAPLLILAPSDEPTTKNLVPSFWQHGGPKPAGVFFHGWEKEYALVRLDAVGSSADPFAIVYHEYTHSLLHLNFRWLPTWLDEGLAEFYGFTRFEKEHTYIGAPPRNARYMSILYRRPSMPLGAFIEKRGSFSKDEEDTQLFYAQSWALTHFLSLSEGMGGGARLNHFFNELQHGTDQQKAFQETFGDFKTVQKNFDQYLWRFAFQTGVIPPVSQDDEKEFKIRTMSVAETNAELGSFYSLTGQWQNAVEYSEAAMKDEPNLALAHETLGFAKLHSGNDDEASRELSKAVELDGTLYRSLFAKTMLSPMPHADSPADRTAFGATLMKVLDTNTQFAPAYVELAKLSIALGDLTRALAMARTAEKLEPSRAGYHLLSGRILLRMGHAPEAAAHAAFVANRWSGPDRDEAMELWDEVPSDKRPANGPVDTPLGELKSANGIVKAVACSEKGMTLTLDQSGIPLTLHQQTSIVGFSDTLWVGREHFTPCYHTTGLRAVVRYKQSSDAAYGGEIVSLGFRDDLPGVKKTEEK